MNILFAEDAKKIFIIFIFQKDVYLFFFLR